MIKKEPLGKQSIDMDISGQHNSLLLALWKGPNEYLFISNQDPCDYQIKSIVPSVQRSMPTFSMTNMLEVLENKRCW